LAASGSSKASRSINKNGSSKGNPAKTNTDNSGKAAKKDYDEQKKDLEKRIDELNNSIEALRKEAAKIRDELVKYIDGLISNGAFARAKKAIEKVEKKSEEASTMANELSKTIADDSSSFGESIRTDLKTKKNKIDTSVLTERQAEIDQCLKVFDEVKTIITSINPDSVLLNADNLPANIVDVVKEKLPYKSIESKLKNYPSVNYYVKALNERDQKKDDPRDAVDTAKKDIEKQTEALFKDIKGEDAKIKDKFPSSGLPSQGGVVNSIDGIKDLFEKDSKKIEQNQEQVQAAKDFNPDYKGMDNVSGDFSGDNQSDFSKQGLSI
jgi:predicted  nucleic acid-binding Zn-ribbon protein